jgi:hypothetical protein
MLISKDADQNTTEGDDIYLMVLDEDVSVFEHGIFLGDSLSVAHVDDETSRLDKRGIIYHRWGA